MALNLQNHRWHAMCESAASRRERSSFLYKHGRKFEFIKSGNRFRHKGNNQLTETATIISIYADGMGIPHVRYDVSIYHPNRAPMSVGPRVLNLRSFTEYFKERIAS
ncbi:hypothetical protein ACTL6U_03025 [Rhodovibrionaceae bacterium A322]